MPNGETDRQQILEQIVPATPNAISETIGFLGGKWISLGEFALGIDDIGFRQAVIAVERLRTYGGRIFQVTGHAARWQATLDQLGIQLNEPFGAVLDDLMARNESFVTSQGDVGITAFATPGKLGGEATFGVHLNLLDTELNKARREQGQAIVVTDVVQPPNASWPRSIKVRCRLHYFLADRFARESDPNALGLLVDDDGTITETSVANVAMVSDGVIYSPQSAQVLPGISEAVIRDLAAKQGMRWVRERISVARIKDADEVLLMGTDTGLWFANQINGVWKSSQPGPVCQKLQVAFARHVGGTEKS